MRYSIAIVAGIFGLLGAAGTAAQDVEELTRKHACAGCHQTQSRFVGPAYTEVAARYDEADKAALVEKVIKGGAGNWGQVPMPPHEGRVPEEDVQAIVDWILSLK